MKNFKKLSVAIVALAMCALLGISAWAANILDVSYTATFDKSTLCITGVEQTATLTVKVSSKVDMDSFTARIIVPTGLTLKGITFGDLTNAFFDLETGMIMWVSLEDAEDIQNDLIAEVTFEVPANAKGTYEIGFEIIDISSDYGVVWETGATLAATLTVAEHEWGEPACSDNGDGTHTANYTCKNNDSHTKSETASHDFTNGDCVCGTAKPAAGLKGDVNLDGKVDALDLAIMARVVPGIENLTEAQAKINADVNEDGKIDAIDLAKFARFVPGIITDWSQD